MTADDVRLEREANEAQADTIAAKLPDGDYYADSAYCVERRTSERTYCGSHWMACLVMMAVHRRMAV